MKKVFVLLFFVFWVTSVNAGYVRKLKEPDFFIPETDKMHKQEKLPEIVKIIPKKKKAEKEVFTIIPGYKNKYSQYLAEMAVFATTKQLTDNPVLDADLGAMGNGDIFEVTELPDQVINSKEQKEFYSLAADIINN